MHIEDPYDDGHVAGAHLIIHEGQTVIALVLIAHENKQDHFSIKVEDIDPLTRSRWEKEQGRNAWAKLSENMYDLMYLACDDKAQVIPIIMPSTLAVTYDNNLRNDYGRECGEQPIYRPEQPHKSYVYRLV